MPKIHTHKLYGKMCHQGGVRSGKRGVHLLHPSNKDPQAKKDIVAPKGKSSTRVVKTKETVNGFPTDNEESGLTVEKSVDNSKKAFDNSY